MVIDPDRVAVVVASAATPAVASALADEHVAFTAVLISAVGVVAGLIAWIDHRIEKRIASHSTSEREMNDMRHSAVMAEIRHLRRELSLPEDREVTDSMGRAIR